MGIFGSYVRGDYVPGSDLDALIEVAWAPESRRADRAARYLPERFPVGMDLFVYTSDELTRPDGFLRDVLPRASWLDE